MVLFLKIFVNSNLKIRPYDRLSKRFIFTELRVKHRVTWHCTKNEVSLRISSVNVTKSAGNCGFGHIY